MNPGLKSIEILRGEAVIVSEEHGSRFQESVYSSLIFGVLNVPSARARDGGKDVGAWGRPDGRVQRLILGTCSHAKKCTGESADADLLLDDSAAPATSEFWHFWPSPKLPGRLT